MISLSEIVENEIKPSIKIYVDMDGVIVDFNGGFKKISGGISPKDYEVTKGKSEFWKLINNAGQPFWENLDWTPDGRVLWDFIKAYSPTILSAPSSKRESAIGKEVWVKKNLGSNVKLLLSKAGAKHAGIDLKKGIVILIDDMAKNVDPWNAGGGVGILHTDAASTIDTLKEILL